MASLDDASPFYDPGPALAPANLGDAATRARLSPAAIDGMVRLAAIWRLTSAEICALMGDMSDRTWFRMKKGRDAGGGARGALSQDTLTRISALVGIFKGLRLLFSEPLSDEWVRLPEQRARSLAGGARSTR